MSDSDEEQKGKWGGEHRVTLLAEMSAFALGPSYPVAALTCSQISPLREVLPSTSTETFNFHPACKMHFLPGTYIICDSFLPLPSSD